MSRFWQAELAGPAIRAGQHEQDWPDGHASARIGLQGPADIHGRMPQTAVSACAVVARRLASGLRSTFAAALPRPMYRITCPSRARLHARSQVLAIHRGLMYRIIGHYPVAAPGRPPPPGTG